MYDIVNLTNEIHLDPVHLGYNPKQPASVQNLINLKNITEVIPIPLAQVKSHALQNDYWAGIVIAAHEHQWRPRGVQSACISAIALIDDERFDSMDTTLPSVQRMLGIILGAGLMTQDQYNGLLALANQLISRAEQLWGLGTLVPIGDVITACQGIGS